MNTETIKFISDYGYLGIFTLIFLQEIGVPNPIPNELVLIYTGYLCFTGVLFLPGVIFFAFSADFIGANLLYFTFFYFGSKIIKHKPKWLPISERSIAKVKAKISKGGNFAIFTGRLTPFIRGYTSVISGLIQIKQFQYLSIAFISALIWSTFYALTGYLMNKFLTFPI